MLQTLPTPKAPVSAGADRDTYVTAYRYMLLARLLDDKYAALYRAGKIQGGVFLGRGQEALSVAIGITLKKSDIFAPLIRDAAGRLAFGETALDAIRTYLGSSLGPMRGRDGNVHRGRPEMNLLPMISHLGAMISVVNGMLFARRMKGIPGAVGVASIGDGATATGSFHESLNQAAIEKLPLVLVVANNQYAYSTPNRREFGCVNLVDRAVGYGVAGHEADGTDLAECLRVVSEAVENARTGQGPQLVVATLLRLCGHGEHDDASYVDPELKQMTLGRDCLKVAEAELINRHWAEPAQLARWRSDKIAHIEELVAQVQHEPTPDPFGEDWSAISSRQLAETHELK
jgi:pyruvate dehydrogenase E1 component alpha subunit/2-oxoisovalerate dehydrogenase E1 component alpha subunit